MSKSSGFGVWLRIKLRSACEGYKGPRTASAANATVVESDAKLIRVIASKGQRLRTDARQLMWKIRVRVRSWHAERFRVGQSFLRIASELEDTTESRV